jgi:hypothetical protein
MRTTAVNNKKRVLLVSRKIAFVDASMGKIPRARDVAGIVSARTADIEKDETRCIVLESGMHIPAVGLQRQ